MSMLEAFGAAKEKYALQIRKRVWMTDPALWAAERLKINLWSIQAQIAQSVNDNKKTVVKSCHDSGKTFLAAVLVCWWIDTHPPEQTRVISTAPTDNQVKKLLWEYIRKMHRNYNLDGSVSEAAEWKSDDRDVLGLGRKPSNDNIHAMNGHHAKYLLFVIDEACGVPQTLWTAAEAVTTNPDNRILAIGNPDDAATEFGRIFLQDDPAWAKFTIDAFSTPNFTDEWKTMDPEVCRTLLDPEWVEEKRVSWGDTSSRWMAKVTAQFPLVSTDTLFSVHLLMQAVDRTILPSGDVRPDLGLDVSRYGSDKTVLVSNTGGVVEVLEVWDKTDLLTTAKKAFNWAMQVGARSIRVDGTGVGSGVVDFLQEMVRERQPRFVVFEMIGAAKSPDNKRWHNARAYWHDHLRSLMATDQISLPDNSKPASDGRVLYEEMEGIRYKSDKVGAMLIESKEDIKARNGKSPDYSDAVVYACAPAPEVDTEQVHEVQPGITISDDTVVVDPLELIMSEEDYVIAPC